MKRRKTVQLVEVLSILDRRLEFCKFKISQVRSDRKKLERAGSFDMISLEANADLRHTKFLRKQISELAQQPEPKAGDYEYTVIPGLLEASE